MIDTDKYEGHTPAPWKWIIDDKDTYLSCFDNDIKADENLISCLLYTSPSPRD